MIDSTPKPLPQRRLGQLVSGLRTRMSGGLQETAAQMQKLEKEIEEYAARCAQEEERLESQYAVQKDVTVTDWDDQVHRCWDEAELATYKAIYDTAEKEKTLKAEAQTKVEQTTAEAQKKINEIDLKFRKLNEAPIQRLRKFRESNNSVNHRLAAIENQTASILTKRSLRLPQRDELEGQSFVETLQTSKEAGEELNQVLSAAKQQADRITNNRLARFVDTTYFWVFSAIFFVIATAVLTTTKTQQLLNAAMSGAGATFVFIIIGYLGVRPLLKRSARREYPKLLAILDKGEQVHARGDHLAVKENEEELSALAEKRDKQFAKVQAWRDEKVDSLRRDHKQKLKEIRKRAKEIKYQAREQLISSLDDTKTQFNQRINNEATTNSDSMAANRHETQAAQDRLRETIQEIDQGGAERLRIATQKAVGLIDRSKRWCGEHFPEWQDFAADSGFWPKGSDEPHMPLGNLLVPQALPNAAKLNLPFDQLQAPVLFSPLDDKYLVIHGKASDPAVRKLVRSVLLRALTTLPAGRTQSCIVDPPGLGQDFGWLMHLGDFDATLVTHRVWTQSAHIGKQLNTLAMNAEDFIQQSLRNEYQNIVEYNRDAGALAEPFRFLVWSSMPNGLDDHSWKSMKSLLDSGARCGIIPILIVDPEESWPYSNQQSTVNRGGLHLKPGKKSRFLVVGGAGDEDLEIEPLESPEDELSQQIVQNLGRRSLLSNRVEVPLGQMLPEKSDRWQADSSPNLKIPIGQSGVGRMHSLKLGMGTAQHAIIAGKTGSGKSSLLHALITSAMMKYSPEALRLVLLDFKKGVEFQVYSDAQVPHADIIGIESHREFGLSALEYVDSCLQRRGEMFRGAGVQDIASWNALHPDGMIPRMLVVIDEFQEIFVEDDKLSGQASLILDRIVRQGRSFGVHAVLSSQTLAGSYSLPRTTLGQMAVRIALQCDAADAQIIFSDDNPAASRLKHPGQAVYNDAGGRIEGNQPMQIGWLPKKTQVQWFNEQEKGYRNHDASTNRLGRTVVYDGNRAATWSDVNAELALKQACEDVNPDAMWSVAGESVAINPAVAYPLTRQSGRNVLIVGGDDAQAAAVQDVAVASFVRAAGANGAQVFAIQGAKPTDSRSLAMTKKWPELNCELKIVDSRDIDDVVQEVHEIVQARTSGSDQEADSPPVLSPPVLFSLIQIGRLRTLRKQDDFASFGESELTPDKKLEEILRDGPSVGVHTMIWAESYSTVQRWLSRLSMREIEIRLLMQMSANDSTNLVDSIAASRLGDHVMLLFDEATGQEQRFRPFHCESLSGLTKWSAK